MYLTNLINVLTTKLIAHVVIKQHCALRIARSERISFTCWPLGGCSPRLKPERQFTRANWSVLPGNRGTEGPCSERTETFVYVLRKHQEAWRHINLLPSQGTYTRTRIDIRIGSLYQVYQVKILTFSIAILHASTVNSEVTVLYRMSAGCWFES
jgi:hypothetical protein